jgi:hypothetical protein
MRVVSLSLLAALDAALSHHFDQVPVRQPRRDIRPHAQLDDVGIKHSLALDRVTGNRLGHSAPRARLSASLTATLDAPEPLRTSRAISPAAGCRIALRTLARIMPIMRLHPVHARQ